MESSTTPPQPPAKDMQRYDIFACSDGSTDEFPRADGLWVRYSDIATLRRQLAEAEARAKSAELRLSKYTEASPHKTDWCPLCKNGWDAGKVCGERGARAVKAEQQLAEALAAKEAVEKLSEAFAADVAGLVKARNEALLRVSGAEGRVMSLESLCKRIERWLPSNSEDGGWGGPGDPGWATELRAALTPVTRASKGSETMKVSATQKPTPHPFYGDSYERGLDPWHVNAFPDGLKDAAPNRGVRSEGWFLLDGFGNAIGFIADGSEMAPASTQGACDAKRG